jgi:hypothetical protein
MAYLLLWIFVPEEDAGAVSRHNTMNAG